MDARYAYGSQVFAIDAERMIGITGFPRRQQLFVRLGLSTCL
jgi:hypothetical protein